MKRKLLFAALCAMSALGTLRAQTTDVTSTYIDNPSFELGTDGTPASTGKSFVAPYKWTATDMPTSGTHNFSILTASETSSTSPSAFGTTVTPSDGSYYYFARHSWSSSLTTKISQTSKAALPAGVYFLNIDYKIAKSDGDLNPKGYLTLGVKQGESSLGSLNSAISASQNNTYFNTASWTTLRVPFKVESEASVDFVITFNFNPGSANIPQEAIIIDNVCLLKADYPAEPVANNTSDLYLYNEKEGLYVSAGQSWGTHATVDSYGYEMTAALSNGTYTLKTQQYNKYLGGLYMDAGSGNWLFLGTGEIGKYYLTQDGYNYMSSNGAGAELVNVTTPTDASVWSIVSKADRKAALASATIDNPANATFLIADANFSRNVTSSVWNGTSKTSDNKTNLNLSGGANENKCAESYHATFSIHQTLSGLTAGVYGLTAQGFYRQDGSDNDHLPVFYLGDETVTFPLKTGSENSMDAASNSFASGLYTTEPIYVRVESDGSIDLGAKLENENYSLWCIWDNFQLTYYGDVTVASVKMKASVDAYNAAKAEAEAFTESSMFAADWTALQDAITANTLDLNDPALTEEALTTATANLVAAKAVANAAVEQKTKYDTAVSTIGSNTNVDLTSLIGNPSFESTAAYSLVADGWANEGVGLQGQTNSGFDGYRVGNVFAERWVASGTIGAFKTSQKVTLPAGIYSISVVGTFNGDGASLFVDGTSTPITDAKTYNMSIEVSDKQKIEFGLQGVSPTGTWFKADNFTLTYVGTVDDLEYTLATGKMGTDMSAAQSAAETTFLANKNLANYDALLAAIANAEASKVTYDNLKAAIDRANVIYEANNFVTADAATAFQEEITAATAGWDDVTYTDAEATAEIAALGSAVSVHRGNKDGKAGNFIVSAWDTNTDGETHAWDGYVINTWSTEGDNDGTNFSVPFLEYWVSNTNNLPAKTMTAQLTGLPNGAYEVELWARVQRRSDADFNSNNSMITMSVNGGEAVSLMSNTENNVGTGGDVMRLGLYKAYGIVEDGTLTLTIDVKLGSNVHWLSWRDVKYTQVAMANMTITDAQYSTFVAPFDVKIPTGVTAYTVEGLEDNGVTLTMPEITSGTITANTPVVLWSESTVNQNFPGKEIAIEGNPTAGWLTGVYAPASVPTDSYVLQKEDEKTPCFYKVYEDEPITIPANRAYLTVPAAEGIKAFYFNTPETAIKNVFSGLQKGDIYDLAGRKVSRMQKGGIYVVNGQKVSVK